MKSFEELQREYTLEEIAESIIFPSEIDNVERQLLLSEFKNHRKKLTETQSEKNKKISLLFRLKFIAEDH